MTGNDWARPPRILVGTALGVLLVCTALAVDGALRTGVSTDEPIHVMRLDNFFATGWYALDWDYVGTTPGADDTNTLVYAPVAMLLLHGWTVLWGVEGWGEVATTPAAYDVRHLGVVLLGLVGVAAVVALGRLLSGRWGWGLVAAASLAAVPLWTGHTMLNIKDVPVATGYTLVTLGLVALVRRTTPSRAVRAGWGLCLVAGLVLTLGTRPGMWPGLLLSVLVAAVALLLAAPSRRTLVLGLAELGGAVLVSGAALVAVYPRLFADPLRALPQTATGSAGFREGEATDRLYVVRNLATQWPTLLLAFLLTGAVVAAVLCWTRLRSDPVSTGRLALVGVQAFALPGAAVLLGSDLYHGLRQLLFLAPAVAVLTMVGMAWWLRRTERWRPVVAALAAASLTLPVLDQLTLQPYQTSYVNLATDLVTTPFGTAADRPGGDYWRVSLPELLDGTSLRGRLHCKATVLEPTETALPFTDGTTAYSTARSLDCRDERHGPVGALGLAPATDARDGEFEAVFLKEAPANCSPVDQVSRWRHGFEVVLTVLARCTVEPTVLGEEPVRVADEARGSGSARDVWRFAVDGWEQWPRSSELVAPVSSATIALRTDGSCLTGCRLELEGTWPADLRATLGGRSVRLGRASPSTLTAPISARRAADPRGVWLRLSRASGAPLEVGLSALRIAPRTEGER